jgi:hypothetical protein
MAPVSASCMNAVSSRRYRAVRSGHRRKNDRAQLLYPCKVTDLGLGPAEKSAAIVVAQHHRHFQKNST